MQRQAGGDLPHKGGHSQIVGNHRVGPGPGHRPHRVGQPRQFAAEYQGVEGYMDPHPAGMAESHRLPQLLRGEIAGAAPGVVAGQAQINSISAA